MTSGPCQQPVGQCLSFQKFHHQKVDSILVPYVVQRADVGMVQGRDRARFAVESLLGFKVVRKMSRQNLDRRPRGSSRVSSARYTSPMPACAER